MEANRINQRWFVKLGNKLELHEVKIADETDKTVLLTRVAPKMGEKTFLGRYQKEDVTFVERSAR